MLFGMLKLVKNLPILKTELNKTEYIIILANYNLKNVLFMLKNHFIYCFKILNYVCGLDYPNNVNRFKLVYDFLSIKYNIRLRVKIIVNEISPVDSISFIFLNAVWWESEAWDMFGIIFSRQKIIIRLLTDYGFIGYPLRKDFPLSGFLESKYNLFKDKITYNKLELAQAYRLFKQNSPWENSNLIKNGI